MTVAKFSKILLSSSGGHRPPLQSAEPDHLGCFHGFIEVAIDGVFHHRPQLFERVALGVDAITPMRWPYNPG
jgi:hypothetical protein